MKRLVKIYRIFNGNWQIPILNATWRAEVYFIYVILLEIFLVYDCTEFGFAWKKMKKNQ